MADDADGTTQEHPAPDAGASPGASPAEALADGALPEGSADETPTGPVAVLPAPVLPDLEHEGEVAADYLEGLLDILDLDGDLDLDVEGERASVAIVGDGLENLVGPGGATLDALQELTRLAVLQATGSRSRMMLDIGGFRAQRRADLVQLAQQVAERVLSTGEPERLAAMTPFERKVVHDAIAGTEGLSTESEGEEPQRRVVVQRG